jgi:uncharacterized membrane protein YeaQ/YmgE (transglycosylase-associated protein family)
MVDCKRMSGQILRIIYLVVLAFIIGTAAQLLTGYRKRPFFTTLLLGFIGVLIGDWLAFSLRLPHIIPPVFGISLLWSTLGAVAFILIYSLFRGRL